MGESEKESHVVCLSLITRVHSSISLLRLSLLPQQAMKALTVTVWMGSDKTIPLPSQPCLLPSDFTSSCSVPPLPLHFHVCWLQMCCFCLLILSPHLAGWFVDPCCVWVSFALGWSPNLFKPTHPSCLVSVNQSVSLVCHYCMWPDAVSCVHSKTDTLP